MEFRILGTVEVVDDDGVAVDLGGPRERSLLARLLVSANRVVPVESLAEDLWAGDPPPSCLTTLRVYVSRLRRALGPAAAALVTRPPGYRLDVAAEHFDVTRFEQLTASGRTALDEGRAETAAQRLQAALQLWRGAPLSDVADLPFARPEVARLQQAMLAALEDRVEADLRCGRHGRLAGELNGLVAVHPLRERLWAQLMLALYRCGRQADALRAFQQVRTVLGDELGIDPGPELRRLEDAILRQDAQLDWNAPLGGERPRPFTVGLRGPVTVLLTDIGVDSRPSENATSAPSLVGRAGEICASVTAAHYGSTADWAGDVMVSVFDAPTGALAAAADLLTAIAAGPWRRYPPGQSRSQARRS